MARERNPVLKGLLRIRRYNQQETPYALQEVELLSWLQFGEAYSALRGWRPIPAALLSHSVVLCSGTEDILPTTLQGKNIPDKQRSIRKTPESVKSVRHNRAKNPVENAVLAWALPEKQPFPRKSLQVSDLW